MPRVQWMKRAADVDPEQLVPVVLAGLVAGFMRNRAALLTSTFSAPKRSRASATARRALSDLGDVALDNARHDVGLELATAGSMSSATITRPTRASSSTVARPTPPAAPVTIATLPSSSPVVMVRSLATLRAALRSDAR